MPAAGSMTRNIYYSWPNMRFVLLVLLEQNTQILEYQQLLAVILAFFPSDCLTAKQKQIPGTVCPGYLARHRICNYFNFLAAHCGRYFCCN